MPEFQKGPISRKGSDWQIKKQYDRSYLKREKPTPESEGKTYVSKARERIFSRAGNVEIIEDAFEEQEVEPQREITRKIRPIRRTP